MHRLKNSDIFGLTVTNYYTSACTLIKTVTFFMHHIYLAVTSADTVELTLFLEAKRLWLTYVTAQSFENETSILPKLFLGARTQCH
jgi:hypothetical protein